MLSNINLGTVKELRRMIGVMKKTKRTTTSVAGGTVATDGSYEITSPTFSNGEFGFTMGNNSPCWNPKLKTHAEAHDRELTIMKKL